MEDHASDLFNCFNITLELLYDLVAFYASIEKNEWAEKVPSRIPFHMIAGDYGLCENYGERLYHVANLLAESGNKVRVKSYPGYRHEIHNEIALREEVEVGLILFMDDVLK